MTRSISQAFGRKHFLNSASNRWLGWLQQANKTESCLSRTEHSNMIASMATVASQRRADLHHAAQDWWDEKVAKVYYNYTLLTLIPEPLVEEELNPALARRGPSAWSFKIEECLAGSIEAKRNCKDPLAKDGVAIEDLEFLGRWIGCCMMISCLVQFFKHLSFVLVVACHSVFPWCRCDGVLP